MKKQVHFTEEELFWLGYLYYQGDLSNVKNMLLKRPAKKVLNGWMVDWDFFIQMIELAKSIIKKSYNQKEDQSSGKEAA